MSSEKNLYEILEVTSSASSSTIKASYRRLARKYHPDLNGGDKHCVEKFKAITEAYEILSNSEKKKNYDILRGVYQEKSQTRYSQANRAYRETQSREERKKYQQAPRKENDAFSSVLNDILEGFKKTTSSANTKAQDFKTKQAKPESGSDVYTDVTISLSESVSGTSRTLNILHTEICPNCGGRTFINGAKCPVCKGLGEQSIHKKLTVKIPANVKHGSKIRIANEGNRGVNGGRNGDLYLNIKIESDSKFKYEGINILCNVLITPFEAVLGATIEIPTVKGTYSMKVTPNTHSGQKYRLAGQGLKQDGRIGDMIVTVNIEVPNRPSAEELELYRKLKDISKTNIREQ